MKSLLLLATLFLCSVSSYGAIYKWTDERGNVRYGDQPESIESKVIEIQDNVYQKPIIAPEPVDVIMYSTAWCGYCKKARKYFIKNKIPYVEYDIERNVRAKRRYKKFAGHGIPLILYGDKHMRGFNESQFRRIYE